jgi:hypothetical protein
MTKFYRLCLVVTLLGATALAQDVRPNTNEGTPLLSTTLSLELARSCLLEERPQAAAVALREAAGDLAAYEELSPGPQAQTAEFIRQQILAAAGRVYENRDELADRIVYLWLAQVNHWYSRAGR